MKDQTENYQSEGSGSSHISCTSPPKDVEGRCFRHSWAPKKAQSGSYPRKYDPILLSWYSHMPNKMHLGRFACVLQFSFAHIPTQVLLIDQINPENKPLAPHSPHKTIAQKWHGSVQYFGWVQLLILHLAVDWWYKSRGCPSSSSLASTISMRLKPAPWDEPLGKESAR